MLVTWEFEEKVVLKDSAKEYHLYNISSEETELTK